MATASLRPLFALGLVTCSLCSCTAQSGAATQNVSNRGASAAAPTGTLPPRPEDCAGNDIQCHERLYLLEETLDLYEAGFARRVDESALSCWRDDVADFRRSVAACRGIACREKALLARLASLHETLPEAQRSSFELPVAPLLLAVLAPEPHARPATNRTGSSRPFEAGGQLVHAMDAAEHMGIAVRSDAGLDHMFIPDADLGNQPGHQEVQALVGTSPTARVLVRGRSQAAADGVDNFDPSACRLVYQLP